MKDKKPIIEQVPVLIAVPAYGLCDYAKKLIPTIKLSMPHVLLLIDNASPDGTGDYFDSLKDNKNIEVIHNKKNLGCAGAWNQAAFCGFEGAQADKVIFLNNDTLLLPDTLDRLVADLDRPGVGLASACDFAGKCTGEADFLKIVWRDPGEYVEAPQFSCFGINRLCYEKIGPFDDQFYPAYYEDNDYHYRMRLGNLAAVCNLKNFYFHFGSRTKIINPAFKEFVDENYLRNRERYLSKWGGLPGEETYKTPFDKK